MRQRRRKSSFFGLAWVALGCAASPPPPPADPPPVAKTGPSPKSAEWLYVTDGVPGGRKAECKVVSDKLEAEARCKGALCAHGAALAKDWLAVCKASSPELASSVEERAAELEKRAKLAPAPCEAEVTDLLRDGCEERKDCREFVQGWATRCADFSTPLVLRMLAVAVERQAGEHVEIDGRGCADLFEPIAKAQACDHQFKCQDVLGALETYRARCETKGKPIELSVAIAQASLLAGALQPNPALAVLPGAKELDEKRTPLPLDDGSGAVLLTCGKRAADVKSYLGLRASCNEELVIAKRFDGPSGPVLRVGHVPHPDDAAFRRRFPSLAVEGELAARYEAELPDFTAAVDAAAKLALDPKRGQDAIRGFVAALVKHLDPVRNSKAFETAITARDTALVPLFQVIGRAKKKAMHPDLSERKLATALHRAEVHSLADVNVDGKVRIGESTFASSLELEDMLPKSFAAYREELAPRFKRLPKLKISSGVSEKLGADASTKAKLCAEAWKRAGAGEWALVSCAFGEESCDAARISSLGSELDGLRLDVQAEYLATALAISSLPEEQRATLWSEAKSAGCSEP